MHLGFEYFHPLEGAPPSQFYHGAIDIATRARRLLTGRSLSELEQAAAAINWMQSNVHQPLAMARLLEQAARIDSNEAIDPDDLGPRATSILRDCVNRFDSAGYTPIPNAQWHELFAVLALALIDKACDDEKYYARWGDVEDTPHLHRLRIVNHVADWLLYAMDAVATAEGLAAAGVAHSAGVEQERNRVSLRSRRAAIAKHAKTGKAVQALVAFKRDLEVTGRYKSDRHTVKRFLKECPADLVGHLGENNRERTLYEHLLRASRTDT